MTNKKTQEVTIEHLCDTLGWLAGQICGLRELLCCLDGDQVIECPPNLVASRSVALSIGSTERRIAGHCPPPRIGPTIDRRVAGKCPDPIAICTEEEPKKKKKKATRKKTVVAKAEKAKKAARKKKR